MKYDEQAFSQAVDDYKTKLSEAKDTKFLITFKNSNKEAFFSLAPLSRALHELGCDVHCMGIGGDSESLDAIKEIWRAFQDHKESKTTDATKALVSFIDEADQVDPGTFMGIFEEPDHTLEAGDDGFAGSFSLPYHMEWFKPIREDEMQQTCKTIWKEVYDIKDGERISCGFCLIPTDDRLGHPLEDYLDSFAISWNMISSFPDQTHVSSGASTQRASMLDPIEKISELKTTLLGCELCKGVDEPVFKAYKVLSDLLNLSRIKPIDASFFIHGKGYPGKHYFGQTIGYPSLDKKTRWQSPGQMIYKLDFYPQTKDDPREPLARVGFTETIPLDIFIDTCNIDWTEMRDRNMKIKDIMDQCETIKVWSGIDTNGHKTDLEVGLVKEDGAHRWVRTSDTDVREKINSEFLKKTGIKAGTMANIPGGESFTTPEYMKGTFVGDVVISIDQSYPLSSEEPLVVETFGDSYKIVTGPKKIVDAFTKKKDEALKVLEMQEEHKSMPQELIDLNKKNLLRVGEFAVNTNPKARLCEYLIVNEKIANMMHIALGSGFEPDRATVYHTDIVIDAPRQKMNVVGYGKDQQEHWIIKDGAFVV